MSFNKILCIGTLVAGAAVVSAAVALPYAVMESSAGITFRQGLQFKVEEMADSDKNGALSVDEMVAVFKILREDPAKRLREGFYLSVEESQKYLKATGQFDPKVDDRYRINKKHPSFEKAEAEGKPVYRPTF